MGSLFAKPELFATLAKVAHATLPFLAVRGMGGGAALPVTDKDVLLDAVVIAGMNQPRDQWKPFYLEAVKNLKPGLTEMIVHL